MDNENTVIITTSHPQSYVKKFKLVEAYFGYASRSEMFRKLTDEKLKELGINDKNSL